MDPLDKVTVEQRLAAIEEKLDAVLARLGMPAGPSVPPVPPMPQAPPVPMPPADRPWWLGEVEQQIRAGRLIHAIKAYRENTGAGLAEAKQAVERMAADLGVGRRGW